MLTIQALALRMSPIPTYLWKTGEQLQGSGEPIIDLDRHQAQGLCVLRTVYLVQHGPHMPMTSSSLNDIIQ